MINRAKLRGKPLDSECKRANRTTHEYGVKDDRVYCYGLYGPYLLGKLTNRCSAVGISPQPVGN